jgi:DNA-binding CsgD family transcriptional regulator
MQISQATQLPQGSLATFLAGPVIKCDNELSELMLHADSLRETPFLVHNYIRQRTVHVSDGMLSLSGYTPKEACEGGTGFVLKITNPDDFGYLMLLQGGFIKEAKTPGFSPSSMRFHDYYWSIVHRNGTKVPVVSTGVMLTYSAQHDFEIGVGFHIPNDNDSDANLNRCKNLLRQIKHRHNQIHLHASVQEQPGPYPIHHASLTADIITQRERQVLGMLAQGHSTEAIAGALSIAANTVESHRKKLLQKFDARNSAELIKKASKIFWLS